jgi:malonyl-ACP O-methyltransferase BioC
MQINPKLIKKQFEKSIETYNENASVQKLMAEKLVLEVAKLRKNFGNILELGCGAGMLTSEIAQKFEFKKYFGNDLVEKSQNYIEKIVPDAVFYCGNAQKIKPTQKMDLIISNAMFQWFSKIDTANLKNMLNQNGILAFSTFSPDNFVEIRELTGLSLNYKSLDELKQIFEKDFEIIYSEEFREILQFSNPLELLAHMKNTGVNSLTSRHWTFKEVKEFCDNYSKKFPKITLTYTPMIFVCRAKSSV